MGRGVAALVSSEYDKWRAAQLLREFKARHPEYFGSEFAGWADTHIRPPGSPGARVPFLYRERLEFVEYLDRNKDPLGEPFRFPHDRHPPVVPGAKYYRRLTLFTPPQIGNSGAH